MSETPDTTPEQTKPETIPTDPGGEDRPLFDPYLLTTDRGLEARTVYLEFRNYRECATTIVAEAEGRAGDNIRGYDIEEHTFLKREFPVFADALEMLLPVLSGLMSVKTPGNLIVDLIGPGFGRVVNPVSRQFLKGGEPFLDIAPEWIDPPKGRPCDAKTDNEIRQWQAFFHSVTFFGGFWQAWRCALRADQEGLKLPPPPDTPPTHSGGPEKPGGGDA